MFDFRHVHSASIGTAKTEVAGFGTQDVDLAQDLARWAHYGNRPFAVTRDIQVAVDVASHRIKAVIGKLFDETHLGQRSLIRDVERSDVSLLAFVHILSSAVVPFWITGVERGVGSDGQVVGLVHLVVMREDSRLSTAGVNRQNVMVHVICDEHHASPVEPDPIAGTRARQAGEDLPLYRQVKRVQSSAA